MLRVNRPLRSERDTLGGRDNLRQHLFCHSFTRIIHLLYFITVML